MSSTFRVRLTPSSRKRVGPRDRAWQRRHGQTTSIGELVGRAIAMPPRERALRVRERIQAEIDAHVMREREPARDALGHAYPRQVPNRIDAEPLDPQTPAYWRAVWSEP